MRLRLTSLVLGMAVLALAGCGGGNGNGHNDNAAAETSSFTAFVKDRLNDPADGEPVGVNGRQFTFDDRDNPDAFNDVLQ